jgi:hypothetical protein
MGIRPRIRKHTFAGMEGAAGEGASSNSKPRACIIVSRDSSRRSVSSVMKDVKDGRVRAYDASDPAVGLQSRARYKSKRKVLQESAAAQCEIRSTSGGDRRCGVYVSCSAAVTSKV